jgi:hypothetical protein
VPFGGFFAPFSVSTPHYFAPFAPKDVGAGLPFDLVFRTRKVRGQYARAEPLPAPPRNRLVATGVLLLPYMAASATGRVLLWSRSSTRDNLGLGADRETLR